MGNKSRVAVASVIVGALCFINLLGMEKAAAAIVLGWMGLKETQAEQKTGKRLAYAGIMLGTLYIITLGVLLLIYGPQFMEHIKALK